MRLELVLQLLLFLLCIDRGDAIVYSCEEVAYKLFNSPYIDTTLKYTCVVTQEGFSNWDVLDKLFIVRDDLGTLYSFSSISATVNHCMKLDHGTSYKVVYAANYVNCDQEFSLIFTSEEQPPYFITPLTQPKYYIVQGSPAVLVVPETGMWIHTKSCEGTGLVTVSTGVGVEVNDALYEIYRTECDQFPDWIFIFENVVTIDTDEPVEYSMECSRAIYDNVTVSPGNKIIVMSSSQSGNLQDVKGKNNLASIVIENGLSVDVSFTDLQVQLDSFNTGYVAVQHPLGGPLTKYYTKNGDYSDAFTTDSFGVIYAPKQMSPSDIGSYRENFHVTIFISYQGHPTVSSSTTTLPPSTVQGEYCTCGVDKFGAASGWNYNDIWIDLVVILDTSEAMGKETLDDASILIESFISYGFDDFLETNPTAPFYSRVGVINMADTATVLYNLNMTKDDKVQGRVSIKKGVAEINVVDAFQAAVDMLSQVKSQPSRWNTRQVIYYMTDSEPSSNLDSITPFKTSGVIIVNNFLQPGEVMHPGLMELASDGYYFANSNYMEALRAFCKANCFCPPNKDTYGGADPAIKAAGGCYHATPSGVPYNKAKLSCAIEGGIVAADHDSEKGRFLVQTMTKVSSKSDYFWIGYHKSDNGVWQWADQSSDPYTNWGVDEPSTAAVSKCAYVDSTNFTLPWGAGNCQLGFPYVCEYRPCSVGYKDC